MEMDAGNKIETSEKGIASPIALTDNEAMEMQTLEKVALIPDIQNEKTVEEIRKKPENERPVIVPVEIIPILETSEIAPEQNPAITLKDIELRYGSLSVVETTDGKTYTGAFSQEGRNMKIFTTEGTITIPSSRISRVSKYRGEAK